MEVLGNRIINGVLKAVPGIRDPHHARELLTRDINIIVDPGRLMDPYDLWPALWALTSVLARQFEGVIFISGTEKPSYPSPREFDRKCIFGAPPHSSGAIRIGLGAAPDGRDSIWGDARGSSVSYRKSMECSGSAHPISAFALAGYLGFAALAEAVGIPASRAAFATAELDLPFDPGVAPGSTDYTFVGLGHLGQAYLSLLFFLDRQGAGTRQIVLVDRDEFGKENLSTQILLGDDLLWEGSDKAQFLASHMRNIGVEAKGESVRVSWGWKRPGYHPPLAILGLDNFDARRMAIEAGYEWIFEAGLSSSFEQPRLTWHSVPPGRESAKIFPRQVREAKVDVGMERDFIQNLLESPGRCGWLTYLSVTASAPSMGLVAAAYLWCEVLTFLGGVRSTVSGAARLWPPLIPFYRESCSCVILDAPET
ncbi:MAG TPA: ThiF family adenylyltransferase [Blastocatellia bacterium]